MKNVLSLTILTVVFVGLVPVESFAGKKTPSNKPPSLAELTKRLDALEKTQVPKGAIAYFASTCPTGWASFSGLSGRYIVGTTDTKTVGVQVGEALGAGENRATGEHKHSYVDSAILSRNVFQKGHPTWFDGQGITGQFSGGTDLALAHVSGNDTSGVVGGTKAGTNAPYLQLMPCMKN
jgi:hypothetical protein